MHQIITVVLSINVSLQYIQQGTKTSVRARGGAVVEALRYKPEGRGIDSRWGQWNFYAT
jgi:hypothetical protein